MKIQHILTAALLLLSLCIDAQSDINVVGECRGTGIPTVTVTDSIHQCVTYIDVSTNVRYKWENGEWVVDACELPTCAEITSITSRREYDCKAIFCTESGEWYDWDGTAFEVRGNNGNTNLTDTEIAYGNAANEINSESDLTYDETLNELKIIDGQILIDSVDRVRVENNDQALIQIDLSDNPAGSQAVSNIFSYIPQPGDANDAANKENLVHFGIQAGIANFNTGQIYPDYRYNLGTFVNGDDDGGNVSSVHLDWESSYIQQGDPDVAENEAAEFHLIQALPGSKDDPSLSHRIWTYYLPHSATGKSSVQHRIDRIEYVDKAKTPQLILDSKLNTFSFVDEYSIISETNDYAFLRQQNAAGNANLELFRLNANDRLELFNNIEIDAVGGSTFYEKAGGFLNFGNATKPVAGLSIRGSNGEKLRITDDASNDRWSMLVDGSQFAILNGQNNQRLLKIADDGNNVGDYVSINKNGLSVGGGDASFRFQAQSPANGISYAALNLNTNNSTGLYIAGNNPVGNVNIFRTDITAEGGLDRNIRNLGTGSQATVREFNVTASNIADMFKQYDTPDYNFSVGVEGSDNTFKIGGSATNGWGSDMTSIKILPNTGEVEIPTGFNTKGALQFENLTEQNTYNNVFVTDANGNVGVRTDFATQQDVTNAVNNSGDGNGFATPANSGQSVPSTFNIGITDNLRLGQSLMYLDETNDYVGINTTTPNSPLDVTGNANFTGTLTHAPAIENNQSATLGQVPQAGTNITQTNLGGNIFFNNDNDALESFSFVSQTNGQYQYSFNRAISGFTAFNFSKDIHFINTNGTPTYNPALGGAQWAINNNGQIFYAVGSAWVEFTGGGGADGDGIVSQNRTINGNRLIQGDGSNALQFANFDKLELISTEIDMNFNRITELPAPSSNSEPARKIDLDLATFGIKRNYSTGTETLTADTWNGKPIYCKTQNLGTIADGIVSTNFSINSADIIIPGDSAFSYTRNSRKQTQDVTTVYYGGITNNVTIYESFNGIVIDNSSGANLVNVNGKVCYTKTTD